MRVVFRGIYLFFCLYVKYIFSIDYVLGIMLCGGDGFRLDFLEIDFETENCELCVEGLLGNIFGRCI